MPDEAAWPFREQIKVRYQEVDLQNVVFNAHYLGFCDIASASWMGEAIGWTGVDDAIDWMLVKATIEWQGSATYGDTLDVDCGIARWGTSSFDIAYRGTVDNSAVFTAVITYVCVTPGTKASTPVPDRMPRSFGDGPFRSLSRAMRRSSVAPIVVGALLVLVACSTLVLSRGPSRDEVHTLQQLRDRSLSSLVDEIPTTSDRSPPAYYLAMWAVQPLTRGDLAPLRAISVGAWVLASVLLGLVVRRHGVRWEGVLAATVVPASTGLSAMGTYARPYALCLAAFCVVIEAWDASLDRPTRARTARILIAGSVAVALNYLAIVAVGCILAAELVARRRQTGRGPGTARALVATAWPLVVSAPIIFRSVDALQDVPREVSALSFPSWYLSVLGPLVPAAVVLGAVGAVLWAATRKEAALPARRDSRNRTRLLVDRVIARPLVLASILLVAVLPSVVVAFLWVTTGAYLHRYSIGAVAGVAVLVGLGIGRLADARRWLAVLAVGLVVCSVPLAVARSWNDRVGAARASDLGTDLGLASTTDLVAVSDEYVYALMQYDGPASVAERTVLAGPATFHGLAPSLQLSQIEDPSRRPQLPETPFVVVVDRAQLAAFEATGRIVVLDELGTARLRYATTDRTLVAARVESTIP